MDLKTPHKMSPDSLNEDLDAEQGQERKPAAEPEEEVERPGRNKSRTEEYDMEITPMTKEIRKEKRSPAFTLDELEESVNRQLDDNDRTRQKKLSDVNRSFRVGFTRPRGLTKVVARERMPGLKDFYLKERKTFDSLVKQELKRKNEIDEDVQARWAIDQFRNAATHLQIIDIIDGKVPIPAVPELEEYIKAFEIEMSTKIRKLEEKIETKRENIELYAGMRMNLRAMEKEKITEKERMEVKSKIIDLTRDLSKEDDACDRYMAELEETLRQIRKDAIKQKEEDEDASARMNDAMDHLKKFLGDLMKKVPGIEPAIRWRGKDGSSRDPFDEGDLVKVMKNLNHHYRSTTGLGKTILLLSGFREPQGNKTGPQHLATIESWLASLRVVGLTSIDIDEFAALVAIATAREDLKQGFLEAETQFAQTLSSLEDGAGKSIHEKAVFQRFQSYVCNLDRKEAMGSRLKAKTGKVESHEKKTASFHPSRDEDVLVVEGELSYHDRTCPIFKASGECRYGTRCSYMYDKKRNNVCRLWNEGKCRYGDTCRFQHPEKDKAGEQRQPGKPSVQRDSEKKQGTLDFSGARVTCVIAEETVNAVVKKGMSLGWDTMASVNVAKDLSMLTDVKELDSKCKVTGLGGELAITHEGVCEAFGGITMKYIPGGKTPNLLSMAEALKADKKGLEGISIMTSGGAIMFRAYPMVLEAVQNVVNELARNDLIEAKAEVVNGVYRQFFDGEEVDESAWAVTSMYAGRVHLTSASQALVMLSSAGATEEALLKGVRDGTIKGLPDGVTEAEIRKFFSSVGKDVEQLRAEVIHAPLREPIDYEEDRVTNPGEMLVIDACDPSFARMDKGKTPVRAIGGYRDAVVAVDKISGAVDLVGRKSHKSPEKVVEKLVRRWIGRWKNLKFVKADKEFVTQETSELCESLGVTLRQAVPGEHRRGTGEAEGAIRWLQDQGQSNMNRVLKIARAGEIGGFGELEARRLWFYALRHAAFSALMRPVLNGAKKTRYEERYGASYNLSNVVMLPFGLPMVVRKRISDEDGRGNVAIYVGPSSVVKAGILSYIVQSGRVQQKYSFVPRERLPQLEDIDVAQVAGDLYGRIVLSDKVEVPGLSQENEDITGYVEDPELEYEDSAMNDGISAGGTLGVDAGIEGSTSQPSQEESQDEMQPSHEESKEEMQPIQEPGKHKKRKKKKEKLRKNEIVELSAMTRPIQHQLEHRYNTRSKAIAMAVEERPPKPPIPKKHEAMRKPEWKKAMEREMEKINAEETIFELPKDGRGEYILPERPIIMRMFEILDYKWKLDPETGNERWLEVIRAVVDGSTDKRKEGTYAETPDRSTLLMMLSIGATIGEKAKSSDAIRAYLNAEALDPNLVVIPTPFMEDYLPKMGILNKGLYGTTKGALGWEVWVEKRLIDENGFQKCSVPRSVYTKVEEGQIARLLRHTDDFRLSSSSTELMDKAILGINSSVRMGEWSNCERFLGLTIEYIQRGENFQDGGNICIVRCTDKIVEMEEKFRHLIQIYNTKRLKRNVPLPLQFLKKDEELSEEMRQPLSDNLKKEYMSLVGSIGYIAVSLRFDARFGYLIVSKRLSNPRNWDMFLAVWTMEYLLETKWLPLILGGENVEMEVFSDASFAILDERKSVKAHCARTNSLSGVFYASATTIKNTVTSVWEAEVNAASDAIDTRIYIKNCCEELYFPGNGSNIWIDNQSAIHWLEGENVSSSTKHVETRIFRMRQIVKSGRLNLRFVKSEDNLADILTKSLPVRIFKRFRSILMGHQLVKGKEVKGVQEVEE